MCFVFFITILNPYCKPNVRFLSLACMKCGIWSTSVCWRLWAVLRRVSVYMSVCKRAEGAASRLVCPARRLLRVIRSRLPMTDDRTFDSRLCHALRARSWVSEWNTQRAEYFGYWRRKLRFFVLSFFRVSKTFLSLNDVFSQNSCSCHPPPQKKKTTTNRNNESHSVEIVSWVLSHDMAGF